MADNPNLDLEGEPIASSSLTSGKELQQTLFGTIITAQRVQVKRDHRAITQTIKEMCAQHGEKYYYSWRVKDKQSKEKDGKTEISGLSIKGANDLARIWGNCDVDARVAADPSSKDHDIFYARFVDLETGFSMIRAFRQRKPKQALGSMDLDRTQDLAFQIGCSKAIRNVITNALGSQAEDMLEFSKRALADWCEKNPGKAKAYIDTAMEHTGITLADLQAYIGRPPQEWKPSHVARVMSVFKSIENGDIKAEEAFPRDVKNVDLGDGQQTGDAASQEGSDGKKTEKGGTSHKKNTRQTASGEAGAASGDQGATGVADQGDQGQPAAGKTAVKPQDKTPAPGDDELGQLAGHQDQQAAKADKAAPKSEPAAQDDADDAGSDGFNWMQGSTNLD